MLMERVRTLSARDYLALPESNEERYELIDGELIDMTRPTFWHNSISYKISFLLGLQLAGSDCHVLGADQAVKVSDLDVIVPDVCVYCGAPELQGFDRLLINPRVIVEVTSPSTKKRDSGRKLDLYMSVPSIEAVLIVEQHEPYVELYARHGSEWRRGVYSGLDATVPLDALGCELALAEVYQGVAF